MIKAILNSASAYALAGLLLALASIGPLVFGEFDLLQISTFTAMALATLGLALAWGYVGILSFGHAAFFGLGAYAYAITTINQGDSTLAIPMAVLLPVVFSLLLGYLLFFGRVGDVYLAVITLCVTLILFSFMNSTADPSYRIGSALLGGFNGIDSVPQLNWPGQPDASLDPTQMFRLCLLVLAAAYCLIRFLLRSSIGRIMVAIRENELRSELIGYDVRLYKMLAFAISAGIAGSRAACLPPTTAMSARRPSTSIKPRSFCFGSLPGAWGRSPDHSSRVSPSNTCRPISEPTRFPIRRLCSARSSSSSCCSCRGVSCRHCAMDRNPFQCL
jgi:ABC-type branched-subunit amino acid transport system permease subunit